LTYLEAISAFSFSAKSVSAFAAMPGLTVPDRASFRLLFRGLDAELRTVRALGLLAPASALMLDGERGRRGDTAIVYPAQKRRRSSLGEKG
jgi:hypothetical protein